MNSVTAALPQPALLQLKSPSATTTTTATEQPQQRSTVATKPSPKDLKTSISKQQQQQQQYAKLPRSSPSSKRPRPTVSASRNGHPTTTTTKPPASVNFIHSVTDFPPLKSSPVVPTTTTTTKMTNRMISSSEHAVTRTYHNHYHHPVTNVGVANHPTKISILTKPATALAGSTTTATGTSKLQPTAREFHPPFWRSNAVTVEGSIRPTVSATTTTNIAVPTVDVKMFPPLASVAAAAAAAPPLERIKSEHSKIQSHTATSTHAPPPIKKVPERPKQKLSSKTLTTKEIVTTKELRPKPGTTKLTVPHKRNDSINDNKPTDRSDNDDMGSSPFDLLRRYHNNNTGRIPLPQRSSGGQFIQRLTPKIKKFSSLKKKVLEERLRQWQTVHGIGSSESETVVPPGESTATATVCVYGFANEIHEYDDDDDDEYDELVENLRDMATKIGPLRRLFIPRPNRTDGRLDPDHNNDHWPAFVEFGTTLEASSHSTSPRNHNVEVAAFTAAQAAVQCWSTLVLGGQTLSCRLVPLPLNDDPDDDLAWQRRCLAIESSWTDPVVESSLDVDISEGPIQSKVLLNNILTDDDLDDEDCLEESLNDIRIVASKYGAVESIVVVRNEDKDDDEDDRRSTNVMVTYSCDVSQAIMELSKIVFGGRPVVATLASSSSPSKSCFVVKLCNIITEDDLEDESCLEESLNDVKELATRYGSVQNVTVDRPDDPSKLPNCKEYAIQIYFLTKNEALDAMKGFGGMLIGGQTVTATIDGSLFDSVQGSNENPTPTNCHSEPIPLYSGDKIISERFAECKRAPKIVNPSVAPRPYAKLVNDESIKPTIIEMLSELTRLQRRAMEENNVKAKRRLVMGLREVARGIRSHKVKLVIMANNLDEYGVIDKTVQDIIDLAKTEEVPIYYELNKKGLGKAVGKSIKVAVVGVQSADGAHQQYKKLMNYAAKNF